MPQHLKFDAAACSSKPYEKASPELIKQLKKIAAFPRPFAPKCISTRWIIQCARMAKLANGISAVMMVPWT